ncbi:hypothetical protein [Amycolatopsis australiensis]|uniref:Uncharacterized protein n=1 Tax=Amycolatopsis australiensis TaxID=546364 RepID=A0A1K1PEC4_9PSEU|nr:hypothetical protein [Amycolatopsis australiensis]SFW45014.1 hypothetical protein SAMN04489730_0441 [Amycolatopsis australiensis]
MDEDYARKLRNWLRAQPEATPRRADEEREWLREVPEPATDDDWVCPVIVLPVPRRSDENGCRMSEAEARSRRNHPSGRRREDGDQPRHMSEAEARSRWNHPTNWHRRRAAEAAAEEQRRRDAEER